MAYILRTAPPAPGLWSSAVKAWRAPTPDAPPSARRRPCLRSSTGRAPAWGAYAVDGWNLEVGAELATYRRLVLIVHGDQDRAVPIEVSRAAVKALPDAEFVTIPDAAHGFGDANREEGHAPYHWLSGLEQGPRRRTEPRGGQRQRAAQPVF